MAPEATAARKLAALLAKPGIVRCSATLPASSNSRPLRVGYYRIAARCASGSEIIEAYRRCMQTR